MNIVKTIMPEELKIRLADGDHLTLIDVREEDEVVQGIIAGAKHIPLGEIPLRIKEINSDDEVILICRSGNRSKKAYEYLESHGYKQLYNLTGGMMAWDLLRP